MYAMQDTKYLYEQKAITNQKKKAHLTQYPVKYVFNNIEAVYYTCFQMSSMIFSDVKYHISNNQIRPLPL